MRPWLIAVIAVVALVLGAVQVLSTLALRDAAQPGSWVRLVPADAAARVDTLDPRIPLPAALRIVFAREALARGDVETAARQIAVLPPSRDRAELNGMLAERRGDNEAAVRAFLEAGAVDDLERHIAAVERGGDVGGALRLQQATVERLRGDRTASGALPEAYYGLGLLEQSYAYTLPIARRRPYQPRSRLSRSGISSLPEIKSSISAASIARSGISNARATSIRPVSTRSLVSVTPPIGGAASLKRAHISPRRRR